MLENLSKRLVPYGRAHPRLRWPILGLLMLAWCLDCAWVFVCALGREIRAVGQEAAAHLRESGLTPQGIHDNAQRLLDAGIRAAKKLPGLWNHVRQDILPLVYTHCRAVWNTARQWGLVHMNAAKVAAPVYIAQAKSFAKGAGCGVADYARRAADKLRADLPQYRRHAPRRALAASLALVLCLGMLPVSAFATEWQSTCPHDLGQHDASCGYAAAVEAKSCGHTTHDDTCGYAAAAPETPCDKSCADTDGDGAIDHAAGCAYTPATEGTPCKHTQGEHDAACGYAVAAPETPCKHVHDESCGGLTPAAPPAVCATCAEAHETADCPVEAVRALIAALPTPEDIKTMTAEAREESGAYDKMEVAYLAYDALTPAQKALLPDAMDAFTALQGALSAAPALLVNDGSWTYPTAPLNLNTAFAGGDGRSASPYLISTAQQLANMSYYVNTTTSTGGASPDCYKLTANIDMGSTNWTPIGESSCKFTGTFDGGGYQVTYTISEAPSNGIGLFGYVEIGGVVKNVGTAGTVSVTGSFNYFGGVAGNNAGTVQNCYNASTITGTATWILYVGGVVGRNYGGTVENCYNTGAVSVTGSSTYAGGVVGYNEMRNTDGVEYVSTVQNCYNTAAITGGSATGGVVGANGIKGTVKNCYNTGAVSGTGSSTYAGGVVGTTAMNDIYKKVQNCVSLGLSVSGGASVTGRVAGKFDGKGTFNNKAREDLLVNGAVVTGGAANNINGAGVALSETVSAVFSGWSGWSIPSGALKAGALPTLTGVGGTQNPTIELTPSYPTEKPGNSFGGGAGTADNPYKIAKPQDLLDFSWLVNNGQAGGNYTLTGDIDLSKIPTWTPIGTTSNPFNGIFDGAGHTVSGLNIKGGTQCNGLFGVIGTSGTVKNLAVSGAATPAAGTGISAVACVGLLAGQNKGSIYNCSAAGTLSAQNYTYAGGLVGHNESGTVKNCYSTASATGTDTMSFVGGVVGYAEGDFENMYPIQNCCYYGTFSGKTAGALVGTTYTATVINSYANSTSIGGENATFSDCGTFDGSGTLTAWNYDTLAASTLTAALNVWVETEDSTNYKTWVGTNPAAPVFGPFHVARATVSFNSNGGSAVSPVKADSTGKIAAPTAPTRTGYTFGGWYKDNTTFIDSWAFDADTATANLTLYAKWTADTYTVSFDLNGATGATPATQSVPYGEAYGTLPAPTRTGYVLTGWFTAAADGTQVTAATTVTTASNHTLYAHWSEKAMVVLDLTTQTVTYDGTAKAFTLQGTNSGLSDFNISYSTANPTNAGDYAVTITREEDGIYQAYNQTATLTISKKPLSNNMLAVTGTYTYTGVAITPTYTVTDGSALTGDDYTAGVTDNTNAGTAKVTITGKGNYTGSISKTFAIAKAPLTVTVKFPLTISKVYDGGTAVTTAVTDGLEVTGLQNGETATASGTWAYDNKNVGSSKTVNITGITITYGTAKSENYSFTQAALTTSGAIEQLTLTHDVSVTSTKAYDGTATATASGGLTNVITSDAVTLTKVFAFNSKDVSTPNQITATTWSINGADKDNYTLPAFAPVTGATITAKPITVAAAASPSVTKVYDGGTTATVDAADYAFSGLVGSETLTLNNLTAAYDKAGVDATKAICTGFTLADGTNGLAANYKLTTTTFDIPATITVRLVTITAKAQTVNYGTAITAGVDQTEVSAATAGTGLVSSHTLDGITLTPSTTSVTTGGSITPSAAIIKSGSADVSANYAPSYATGVLKITGVAYPNPPAAPTVTATFGQTLSELTPAAVAGGTWSWKNGETIPTVGNKGYAVTFTPTDTNYAPFDLTATVTVTPKALTLPGFAATGRAFTPADTAVSYTAGTLTELVSGFETVSVVTDGVTASIDSANQGTRSVTLSGELTLSGEHAGNYTLTQPTGITVTIAPRAYGDGTDFTVAKIPGQPYTGVEIKPEPVIQYKGVTLVRGTDYEQTLTYAANMDKGTDTASVTATLKSNYSGNVTVKFSIVDNPLDESRFTDVFGVSKAQLATWHTANIVLTAKAGWTIGMSADSLGDTVTLSKEGAASTDTFYAKDSDGKVYQATVTYALDKTAPKIDSVRSNGAWSNQDKIIEVQTVTETGSGIEGYALSTDNSVAPTSWQASASLTVTESGTYYVWVKDKAGNTSYFSSEILQKIDRIEPIVSSVTQSGTQGENGWYTDNVTVTVDASDSGELNTAAYSFDGGQNWQAAGTKTYTADGEHTVTVWVRDMATNIAKQDTFTIKLDKATPTAPTVNATVDGKAYTGDWTAANVVFTLSGTPTTSGHAKYQVKVGDAEWADVTGETYTVSANTPGENGVNYSFRAVNNAGTDGAATAETLVKRRALDDSILDSNDNKYTADNLKINGAAITGGWYTAAPTVTVTRKDTLAGNPADTYYKLDNGVETKLTGTTISVTGDGTHSLTIWTKDAAGNRTTPLVVTVKVDATAPTISDVTGNAASWQNTDVTLAIAATDATSDLAAQPYSFDSGATWQAEATKGYSANATLAANAIQVKDAAGNIAKYATEIQIDKIDKTVPAVFLTPEIDPLKWYGETTITVTATDTGSGVVTIQLSGGGYENKDITAAANFDISQTGTYTVTVTDGAGNTKTTAVSINLDVIISQFELLVSGVSSASDLSDLLGKLDTYAGYTDDQKAHIQASDKGKAAYDRLQAAFSGKQEDLVAQINDIIAKHPGTTTLADIDKAEDLYALLDTEHKGNVDGKYPQMLADRDAAKHTIEQIGKEGATYEDKQTAQNTYDNLSDAQKALVGNESGMSGTVEAMKADMAAVNAVIEKINAIQKPYKPEQKTAIVAAKGAYDALTVGQKALFPTPEKARLDALIDALPENSSGAAVLAAQKAYDSLSADEKALVSAQSKTKLDAQYKSMLDKASADEKAAAIFTQQVTQTAAAPTVPGIEALKKAHDALSEGAKAALEQSTKGSYAALISSLTDAVRELIKELDAIDISKLTPASKDTIAELDQKYGALSGDQKALVDSATGGKLDQLTDAVREAAAAETAIGDIPKHSDGSGISTDDCGHQGGGHTIAHHKGAIEAAKLAYERLTDAGRALVSSVAKAKLSGEYTALMQHLEYKNTTSTTATKVEVAGLAERVQMPPTASDVTRTTISVVMKDEKVDVSKLPEKIDQKKQAVSVDIKLEAQRFRGSEAAGGPVAVQPKQGETVLIKLKVPAGYQNDTLEIWHVKDNGPARQIAAFWLVSESDGTYAVFEVSSFSHFVLFAEQTPTPPPTGGGDVTPPAPKPDVPDTDNGSSTITPQRPKPGDKVTITPKPDEGYVVDKIIVTDQNGKEIPVKVNGDGSYSYTQPKGKVTVTVTFKPTQARLPWNPFTDVTERDWFYESVKYVYEQGLMNGTSDTAFSPYMTTSRGMIVTILWRLEGEPGATAVSPFVDVAADSYCAKAVVWGAEHGIVKGYGNGNFGPNNPITREQLASILYRYAQVKGMDTTAKGDMTQFTDQPSSWAAESVQWAVGAGIISGKGNGILDPMGKATRAETAKILTNFAALLQN